LLHIFETLNPDILVQKYDAEVFEEMHPTLPTYTRDRLLKEFYYESLSVLSNQVSALQLEEPPTVPISPPEEEEQQPATKNAKIYDELMKKLLIVD
jgi:hypothetical protein